MGLTVYGPTERWPEHQKPYWKRALKQAREAGWSLHHLAAAHRFGVLTCPAGEHTVNVDQTARGAETVAKDVPKRLRGCTHGTEEIGSKVEQRRVRAETLLTSAEKLLDAADRDLGRLEASQAAWAELDRLELLVATAEVTLADVAADQEAAWRAAIDLEDVLEPAAIRGTLAEAEEATDEASLESARIRRPALTNALTRRVGLARARIDALKSRAGGL